MKVSSGAASVAAPPSKPPGAAAAAPSAAPTSGSVGAYQSLLDVHLAAVADAADAIGGEVMRATRVLADAFTKERDIIAAFAACQQPAAAADLQALLQPTADAIIQAGDLASGPRSPYISHFKLVGEACQALTWVAYSGPSCGE